MGLVMSNEGRLRTRHAKLRIDRFDTAVPVSIFQIYLNLISAYE